MVLLPLAAAVMTRPAAVTCAPLPPPRSRS